MTALSGDGVIKIPGLLNRWVRLASGANAHYATAGESGPNVVLLHGGIVGSSGAAGWRYMAPFLGANGFRVYCPDQPGFGLTEGADLYHPSLAGTVDFIEDFVNALCLDRFHVGGNSQGCQNAQNYLVAHPERVLSGAFIASNGFGGDITTAEERSAADTRTEKPPPDNFDGTEESMRQMMLTIIHRKEAVNDDLVAMRTAAANRNAAHQKARRTYAANPDPNVVARMSIKGRFEKLATPMIYLHGKQDVRVVPELSYDLYEKRVPNVQFFSSDECGHQGQTDQPEMFNQVFLVLFRDGRVSRKTADWAGVSDRRPELTRLVEEN